MMRYRKMVGGVGALIGLWLAALTCASSAQTYPTAPRVHLIYMGGDDCPPCVAWRRFELPKLQATESFKAIRFTFVTKLIRSPVPASFFLPDEVKPYKDKLDHASGGRSGSPQFAVLVNDEIYDYYYGARSAEQVEQMLIAIRYGTPYPFSRCLRVTGRTGCAIKGT